MSTRCSKASSRHTCNTVLPVTSGTKLRVTETALWSACEHRLGARGWHMFGCGTKDMAALNVISRYLGHDASVNI